MRRFAYGADPLCLVSLAAYALNRFWLRDALAIPFLRDHFDDLWLIPAALPLVLWLQRRAGWRTHDQPPTGIETAGHLVVWSIICEIIGPRWLHRGTADPVDVMAYGLGAVAAWLWWNRPPRLARPEPG